MCGIAGILDLRGDVPLSPLERMAASLRHRGPDDEGFFVSGPVGLAVRRLSIIDVSGGHQPMANEAGSCWVAFNGEIYNFGELRERLARLGHTFRSASDTETILHAYEESGAECVHALNGMFAFALWDAPRRTLLLARDRLGIKPLYYAWDGRRLLFASEIKAILAAGLVAPRLNLCAVWDYLTFRYVPEPETIWEGIFKLPPGHLLEVGLDDGGPPRPRRYWELRYAPEPARFDERADVAGFSALLLDAVQRQLVADVPVGILLSGGIDSSSVTAAAVEVRGRGVRTFSVAFAGGGVYDERPFAREAAARLGTDHDEVVIGLEEFLAFLPELVWFTDEPLADPAAVALYHVAKLAAGSVKVVLSGEGGDEILAGYGLDQSVAYWRRIERFQRLPVWARRTVAAAVLRVTGPRAAAERLARGNIPLAERNRTFREYMTRFFGTAEKRALWPDAPPFADSEDRIAGYYERAGVAHPLHQSLYALCQDWLVEDLLMKADRMTMANSLELRVPLLDHRLVEWLATRSPEAKVHRTADGRYVSKYVLRRFAEGKLPPSILRREKRGFPVPLVEWMRGPLGEKAVELLLGQGSRLGSLFQPEAVRAVVERGRAADGGPDAVHKAWLLLVLELWARRWL